LDVSGALSKVQRGSCCANGPPPSYPFMRGIPPFPPEPIAEINMGHPSFSGEDAPFRLSSLFFLIPSPPPRLTAFCDPVLPQGFLLFVKLLLWSKGSQACAVLNSGNLSFSSCFSVRTPLHRQNHRFPNSPKAIPPPPTNSP